MAADDLTRPLGTEPPRRGVPVAAILLTLLGAALVAATLWLVIGDDPAGDETEIAVPIETAPEPEGTDTVVIRGADAGGDAGVTISTPDGSTLSGGSDAPRQLAEAPSDMLEASADGPLPRVAADGLRPFDAYARPAAESADRPRIAIIVGGLGINTAGTERALDLLPPEISLALAPYGDDLAEWAGRARAEGHEIFLQVPLEPLDFPVTDPGPQTLLVDDAPAENIARLHWLMARFTAYAGVMTYAGGRFNTEPDAMAPVVDELAGRGLMLVDDGGTAASRAAEVAVGALPFAAADLVLDTTVDAAAIDSRLAALEAIAEERGFAIASASAFSASVEQIAAWAGTLAARGFDLVPVTALADDPGRPVTFDDPGEDAVVIEIE